MSFDGVMMSNDWDERPTDFDSMVHCRVDIGGVAVLFDLVDWHRLRAFKLLVSTKYHGYAMIGAWAKGERLVHRWIMDAPKGYVVDHRNHNKLDNRRLNLRIVHPTLNNHNSWRSRPPGERGVRFHRGGWEASLGFKDRQSFIGRFETPEEVLRAYDRRAIECFGVDAWTNYPITDYEMPTVRLVDTLPATPIKHNRQRALCLDCNTKPGRGEACLCVCCERKRGRREDAAREGREITFYAERVKEKAAHCTVHDCQKPVFARNLCDTHWREQKQAEGTYKRKAKIKYPCSVPGCMKLAEKIKERLCRTHFNEKHGIVRKRTGRPPKPKS